MAPSGRELSPKVTEGVCGRLNRKFALGIDIYRTSRPLRPTPPIESEPLRHCDNLPPSRLRRATSLPEGGFGLAGIGSQTLGGGNAAPARIGPDGETAQP